MKKTAKRDSASAEMRQEYDFGAMSGGIRGKYHRRFQEGVNVALLDPEIAKAFPTDDAVNEALRTVLRAAKTLRQSGRLPNKGMQQPRSASPSKRGPRS